MKNKPGGRELQVESKGDGGWGGPSMGRVEGPGSADDAPGGKESQTEEMINMCD